MISSSDNSLLSIKKDLISELNVAISQEESLLLQKEWVKWMGLGDGNNSFFHQQCKLNWNHNKILVLEDENGDLTHGQASCANVVVHYFHDFLGPSCSSNPIDISMMEFKVVSEDQARLLEAPVTDIIIFDTIKKMWPWWC